MAETFTADWLALREPVDHRARATDLVPPLVTWWSERGALRVLDLGSGTGSNLRWLAPRLDGGQRWRLVDHDSALLAAARASGVARVPGVASVEAVQGDLDREGLGEVAGADLVTASALLDLVSQDWLDRLVAACSAARCAALFALTWDGVIEWGDAVHRREALDDAKDDAKDDAWIAHAVRAHQERDKGFGPALGPAAGAAAERAFTDAGYETRVAGSPWVLGSSPPASTEGSSGSGDRAVALALIEGWERAAAEQRPADVERVRAWAERRRRSVSGGAFRLTVGHLDLLALPPG